MNLPSDMRFLIVDDSASIRDVISRSLSRMGFTKIDAAKDVEDAWTKIEKLQGDLDKYDYIISDLNMPGPSGLDFLEKIRSDEKLKETPFLLITTESEKAMVVKAAMSGVSEYVVKPFDFDTFTRKVINGYKRHNTKVA